jgi:ferredoxin
MFCIRLESPEGRMSEVPCAPGQSILDAAEAQGLALPYSCRSGACATCAGRVTAGTVEIDEQFILGDSDLARGYTLLCCAVPTSDCSVLTHRQAEVEGM